MVIKAMHCEQVITANGLNILFIDAPDSQAGSVQAWFRAGSALESAGNQGIAHFLEHMFFKGTTQRSGDDMAREAESFGGELNAFTSFDYTCYYINTPSSHLLQAADIIMDMVSRPAFKDKELLSEKDVVFEEYLGSLDEPHSYAFNQLQETCFSKGYNHSILGTEKSIKQFNRKQLVNFRKKFYNRNNFLLVVAGNYQKKQTIITALKGYHIPAGSNNAFPRFTLHPQPQVNIHVRDVHHCQISIAVEAPDYKESHAPAEDLAMSCMGYGESSRLYQSLVAHNTLADQASASTTFLNRGGFHHIKLVFPYEHLKDVLSQTKEILFDTASHGFSHADICKTKNQYLDSKIYERESLDSFAFSRGQDYAQTGDINSEESYLERIKKTMRNYVNQSLKNILARPIHVNLQIPQGRNAINAKKLLLSFSKQLNGTKKPIPCPPKTNRIIRSQTDAKVSKTTIVQGVSFLHRQNSSSPTFVLHAYVSSGHSHETPTTLGSHSLMAQLLTRGYDGIPLAKIKESLETLSASLNGFAGKNAYGLTLHGQIRHFDELLEHFTGCLLHSDMKAKEILHFKKIFTRTLEKRKRDPYRICFKAVKEIMFQNHPYAQESLGTPATLKKVKRPELLALHQKNLAQKNVLFSCFGDVEYEQALSALDPILNSLGKRTFKLKKRVCKAPSGQTIHLPMKREQVHFFTGIPTRGFHHKENIYLKILTTHLSRFSSELFKNLREKQGLCYSSHPVHYPALEAGYWGLYVASSPLKVNQAIEQLKKIIAQLRRSGISQENFKTTKSIIEGKELMGLQTNEDYANLYSITTLHEYGLDFHHKELDSIKNLAYQDFQNNISKILSRDWNDVCVGH